MSDDMSREATRSHGSGEQTFEINIKLIDNQVHKVHITKDMPVAVLKGKLTDITGASVDQQYLFFGGRVLNDDQTLSEYYVKERNTLHLVTRRYGQSAPGSTSANGNRNTGNDSSVNRQCTRPGKGPRNVIFGVNMTETGTGEEMTDQIGTYEAIGPTPPPRSPPPAEPPPPHVPTSPPGPLLPPPQALHGLKRRRENLSPSTFFCYPEQPKPKMICVKLFYGGEIQYGSNGVFYNMRSRFSFPVHVPSSSRVPGLRTQPSTSCVPEPRSRPSSIQVRKPVPDYLHVQSQYRHSQIHGPANHSHIHGSNKEVRPTSQSHSHSWARQSQCPITGWDNERHPVEIFNDISAVQVANVSVFGREGTFDDPLAVGKVYESKAALRIAINKFHSKHNFQCQYNEPTRLVVVCKDELCKFRLSAEPHDQSESWIIKQSIPHTCKVPSSTSWPQRSSSNGSQR